MVRMGMVAATCLMVQAGSVLAQPADTTNRVLCKGNSTGCSTSETVYPGTTAYFNAGCSGLEEPLGLACTSSHPSTVCEDDPGDAVESPSIYAFVCHCTNPATYENPVTVTAKVTCKE